MEYIIWPKIYLIHKIQPLKKCTFTYLTSWRSLKRHKKHLYSSLSFPSFFCYPSRTFIRFWFSFFEQVIYLNIFLGGLIQNFIVVCNIMKLEIVIHLYMKILASYQSRIQNSSSHNMPVFSRIFSHNDYCKCTYFSVFYVSGGMHVNHT